MTVCGSPQSRADWKVVGSNFGLRLGSDFGRRLNPIMGFSSEMSLSCSVLDNVPIVSNKFLLMRGLLRLYVVTITLIIIGQRGL